jgi:hypothetical protein
LRKPSSPEWRQKLHERWLDVRRQGKLLATQKRIVAFVGYWISGIVFLVLMMVFIVSANALLLLLFLGLYLCMLTVMFAIIPLAPVANTILFLAQWLGLVLREGLRPSISRARIQFKAGVVPWFVPLMGTGVCFFVVYAVDSLTERVSILFF